MALPSLPLKNVTVTGRGTNPILAAAFGGHLYGVINGTIYMPTNEGAT